jgi:dihydroorotate dehydrogenase
VSGLIAAATRRALFCIDPETAHRLAIRTLASGLVRLPPLRPDPRLSVSAFGLGFANPLGMAAGFDKDAEVPDALLGLGFGFVEVGTVTPRPQAGNPRPRVFRLTPDRALINRLGFNNGGHAAARARLAARPRGSGADGVVGVNLGANKDAADRIADYVAGIDAFADLATYFTINVSSPNTPGLRSLQEGDALAELLARTTAARDAAADRTGRRVPLLLKVAPDLDTAAIAAMAGRIAASSVDGLVVSNTTLARGGLADRSARQAGGLSGRPLFHRSTVVLARFRAALGARLPIVGVGGVDSAERAFAKLAAGASLVQLYTGLVYEGPMLVRAILRGLSAELDRRGLASIADAVGTETDHWASLDPDG